MSRKPEQRGLGRGLSALLGDIEVENAPSEAEGSVPKPVRPTTELPIEKIRSNPDQPRRDFAERELNELAESIRQRGVIQPVVVRPDPNHPGDYQLVAGERRWRAAQRAQIHAIPVVIRELDDRTVLEVAIIENVQRANLNPVEEATGYAQLVERFSYTQDALAQTLGKSRSHVANTLRLLGLPEEVQAYLRAGRLTAGHARALIGAADPVKLAEDAVRKGLTVRQVEELARRAPRTAGSQRSRGAAPQKDADTRLLEGDLSAALRLGVSIHHAGDGSGEMRIRYRTLEDLDRLCQRLSG